MLQAHANFSEYVPFILVMLGLAEAGGAAPPLVHGVGASLVLARIAQAWGLGYGGPPISRRVGTISTGLIMLITSAVLLGQALPA